jgi:predicted nucleic acid-binding Zn ribbon protein
MPQPPASEPPRRRHTSSIGEAIADLLRAYRLEDRFHEAELLNAWDRLMGAPIARRTTRIFVKNRVLYVEVDSAPLKSELSMTKGKILDLLQRDLPVRVVDEVVFL